MTGWRAEVERWRKSDPDRYQDWLERCSIMEFDGLLSREDAERRAWECVRD